MRLCDADKIEKMLTDSYRSAGMPLDVYKKVKRWLKKAEVINECDGCPNRCYTKEEQ